MIAGLHALGAAPGRGGALPLECFAACWSGVTLPDLIVIPLGLAVIGGAMAWVIDFNAQKD